MLRRRQPNCEVLGNMNEVKSRQEAYKQKQKENERKYSLKCMHAMGTMYAE